MSADPRNELDIRRQSDAVRMAVARVTGVAENRTRFARCTEAEALATIGVYVQPLTERDRRLALAHAAAMYVDGEHQYQRDCTDLLVLAGADLDLARQVAQHRRSEGRTFLQVVVDQANQRDR